MNRAISLPITWMKLCQPEPECGSIMAWSWLLLLRLHHIAKSALPGCCLPHSRHTNSLLAQRAPPVKRFGRIHRESSSSCLRSSTVPLCSTGPTPYLGSLCCHTRACPCPALILHPPTWIRHFLHAAAHWRKATQSLGGRLRQQRPEPGRAPMLWPNARRRATPAGRPGGLTGGQTVIC